MKLLHYWVVLYKSKKKQKTKKKKTKSTIFQKQPFRVVLKMSKNNKKKKIKTKICQKWQGEFNIDLVFDLREDLVTAL